MYIYIYMYVFFFFEEGLRVGRGLVQSLANVGGLARSQL